MDLPESSVRELIQEDDRSKWIAHSNHSVRCFTENEIKRMTNNYETMLGKGSFGEVYKGVLEDTSMVAVKKFTNNVKENFAKEFIVHREINHKNVVRLIGYCLDENALMMVTEYISKGNLSNVLHDVSIPIPLDTRLRIAIECAEALGYMHSQMYTRVIHGDIKPANILLDDGLRAKVSDFGISRLVNTDNTLYTLNVIGSIGYMDPLFARNGRLTAKSDVYSFGVVLLELITRKKARIDDVEVGVGLVESFTHALARGIKRVREMFDADIATPGNMKTIEEIAKLAGKCLRMELDKRPEMLEVAVHLHKLRKAIHQGQKRLPLFSWGMKKKSEAPANTGPLEESSKSIQKVKNISVGSIKTTLQLELKDLYQAEALILGKGTFGLTYSLKCRGGAELVLKWLDGFSLELTEVEFERRITSIGAIQSKHIVPLRGYYYNIGNVLVLYDNMPMSSLAKALHGNQGSCQAPLDWEQRSAILLDVARGVEFIHSFGPLSVHGNIKSSNVLLTSTHHACVSEHGLRTLLSSDNSWEFRSQKTDVHQFGILLMELLTHKAPVYDYTWDADLPQWVCSVPFDKWAVEVFDVELLGQQYKDGEEECMIQLLRLAINCCSKSRPAMCDVVQQIENILQPK